MKTRQTKSLRPRVRKARPLLVAVGAVALLAGCGDDTTTTLDLHDMGIPVVHDLSLPPRDLTPSSD